MQVRTQKFTEIAFQTRDIILAEFIDVLEHPSRTKIHYFIKHINS